MGRFFSDEREFDRDVAQNHNDHGRPQTVAPHNENGGSSNEAFLADYRNRAPYHYIEEGVDGYYYWQYGTTVELEFTILDNVAITDATPPYLVDVLLNGLTVVDKSTGIASIEVGTMAFRNSVDFFTRADLEKSLTRMDELLKTIKDSTEKSNKRATELTRELYALLGQQPGPGNDYTVIENIPFTIVLNPDITSITVNGVEFDSIVCLDGSDISKQFVASIETLPKHIPLMAIYDTHEETPRLLSSFVCLPLTYISDVVIPAVEKDARIGTDNLSLRERELKPKE